MKKVVAFIPIKLNNERLPGKNIKAFDGGQPLIHYIMQSALDTALIDETYIFCSNESIKEYLPTTGVTFLRRDECLDLDTASISEVIGSFASLIDADVYVLLHATAPFIRIESISNGIEAVSSGEYDSAIAVTKHHDLAWIDGKPNYDTTKIPRTQDLDPFFIETTGMYIFERELAIKSSRIGQKPFFIEVSPIEAIDINEPIDFEIANAVYKAKII